MVTGLVLNELNIDKKTNDVYLLIDFITSSMTSTKDFNKKLELTKEYLLIKYPDLRIFCDNNQVSLNSKLDTYKAFQSDKVNIVQDLKVFDKINKKTISI